MIKKTKIFLWLLIVTLWACISQKSQESQSTLNEIGVSKYESNISIVDGKFVIDTNAILNNNNLSLLIDKLEKTELKEKKSIGEIPLFIKSFLDSLTQNFSIANPGEDWQEGCVVLGKENQQKVHNEKIGDTMIPIGIDNSQLLPRRQLIYFGLGKDIALMTYYTGGFGKSEHIFIIKFEKTQILDFWCGNILNDLSNKKEILEFLKKNKDKHWGLNTNIIYL